MAYTINHISTVEKEVEANFTAEEVSNFINQQFSRISRTASLKGFRKGKAPLNVIKQFYGKEVLAEAERNFLTEGIQEPVAKEHLNIATQPEIFDKSELKNGEPFSFKFHVETFPNIEIELKPFEHDFTPIKYDESMLESELAAIRKRFTEYKESEDGLSADNDKMVISFSGKDGENEIQGTNGKDVTVVLGEKRFVPDFENALYNHKKGDSFTADVKFPDDYKPESGLAGKTVQFSIEVTKLEKCTNAPELTDEFLAGKEGYPNTLEELKTQTKQNIENYLNDVMTQTKKELAISTYVKNYDFELPPSFFKSEREARIADYKHQNNVEVVPEAEITKIEDDAKYSIKRYIIINTLADKLNVSVSDKELDLSFANEARSYGLPAEYATKLREYCSEEQLQERRYNLREQKILEQMAEKMVFTEKTPEK